MDDAQPGRLALTRRGLLAAGVAGALHPVAARAGVGINRRLSIAEPSKFVAQSPETRQLRFDLYKKIGIGTLRVSVGWWDQETADGVWRSPSHLQYLKQAIKNGFRFKMQVGTISMPPDWFLAAHPDAQLLNQENVPSHSDIAYWYPGLHDLIAMKSERLFSILGEQNLFAAIDYIFVDSGPAAEPIYPANWTLDPSFANRPTSFWFYDRDAKPDFQTAMRKKFNEALSTANQSWGTSFPRWSDVRIPEVGTHPGEMWNDVLIWYRGAKRKFVVWQIANYKSQLERHAGIRLPQLVLMIPGSHIPAEKWRHAVSEGRGDISVMLMGDSEYLIEVATKSGCWLQYTGIENAREVEYLRNYMKESKILTPMWGENGGSLEAASNPDQLFDVVHRNNLYGLEYINVGFLFENDGVTVNEYFKRLELAAKKINKNLL